MLAFSQSLELSKAHPYFYKGMVEPNYSTFAEQFDLTVEDNFDNPAESISRVQPDIIMLDPGPAVQRVPLPDANALKTAAASRPIIVYSTLDAHYHSHHAIAKYLDMLQPEAIFSHDFYHDYFPEKWRNKQIFVPNSYNHKLFRNLDIKKDIMCGFYGAVFFGSGSYPWRQRVAAKVVPEFPSCILPRPTGLRDHGIIGEPFVKIMNRTQFIFGCTSLKNIPVKKLFEVPACGAMLMTNESTVLQDLGFKDKVNCCFVDTNNVLQTIRFYLDNPEVYAEVVAAGQELVETQHRSYHRQHILNWWHAYRAKKNACQIMQSNVIGEFIEIEMHQAQKPLIVTPKSSITKALIKARKAWLSLDYQGAADAYLAVVAVYPLMAEAVIGAVGSLLIQGQLLVAKQHLEKYFTMMKMRGEYVEYSVQLILYAVLLHLRLSEYDKARQLLSQHSLSALIEYVEQPEKLLDSILALPDLDDFDYSQTVIAPANRESHFRMVLGLQVDFELPSQQML